MQEEALKKLDEISQRLATINRRLCDRSRLRQPRRPLDLTGLDLRYAKIMWSGGAVAMTVDTALAEEALRFGADRRRCRLLRSRCDGSRCGRRLRGDRWRGGVLRRRHQLPRKRAAAPHRRPDADRWRPRMKIAMVALTTLLAGSAMGDGFFGDDCRYTAGRNASTPAAGSSARARVMSPPPARAEKVSLVVFETTKQNKSMEQRLNLSRS